MSDITIPGLDLAGAKAELSVVGLANEQINEAIAQAYEHGLPTQFRSTRATAWVEIKLSDEHVLILRFNEQPREQPLLPLPCGTTINTGAADRAFAEAAKVGGWR